MASGRANDILWRALHPYPADLTIATKVGPLRTSTGEMRGEAGPSSSARPSSRTCVNSASTSSIWCMAEARAIAPVAAVQNALACLISSTPGWSTSVRAGIAFMPFFALGGGHTTLVSENLDRVAKRHGATVFQVAIAWGLARSPSIVQIPGTASLAHLEENMAAAYLKLDEADMALLGHR